MSKDVFVSTRKLVERYGVSDRTIDRWLASEALEFPQPILINKRRYWRLSDIEAWEQAQARRT